MLARSRASSDETELRSCIKLGGPDWGKDLIKAMLDAVLAGDLRYLPT